MAHRTNTQAVCDVIETALTGDQVKPFIQTANLLVDEHLGSVTPAITAALLKEIETYLAAHFLTLWDPRVSKEQGDDVSFTFEGKTGEGLSSSRYGQMAITLDPTGKLRGLDNPKRVAYRHRIGNERDVEG